MRNLYSLSNAREIKELIQKIEVQRSEENEQFELGVNNISTKIYSPMAKVICYSQLFEYMIPKPDNVDQVGADEMLDETLKLILSLKSWNIIEGLYIDAQIM